MELHYLEVGEQLSEEELLYKKPNMIRLSVVDRKEARKKLAEFEFNFESIFKDLTITKKHEIHNHDIDPNKNMLCIVEDLTKDDKELDVNSLTK